MPTPSRRKFLQATAAGSMLLPLGAAPAENHPPRVPVVDTHVHCFAGTKDKRFPYHARAPYRPDSPAPPEHLLKCMDGAGVDFAVIVHPEPYQDDHRYLEHCLEVGKNRLKGTCLFFADRPNAAAQLRTLAKKRPIVALRIHAYAPERLPPFGKRELGELWKQAGGLGLAVQLHFEPRYAAGFEPLIREFADILVIIDHLGRPFQGTAKEHEGVVRWARFKNTVLKLSAIPTPRQYPHRNIGPVVKQLITAFGPERLIYGGGYQAEATAASYRVDRERTREFLAGLLAADQAKVLGGNAARLFRFPGERKKP